ncbi:MAG TPA: murein biosynthesis integral membrane protein MurJ [Verrucomicrobiae bacterium]|jgi:putative peptidoglycan lipid II flippase
MLKSSGAMASATLTSRVLGMVREIVYARFMGETWVAGAFIFAFQIPNLFRRLLGEGALTAAFIPIFKEKEKIHGEEEMWRAANAVISGLVIATAVIVAVVMLGISLALGVHHFSDKTELMLQLLQVMFPYLLLVCLAAAFMGMLNARGHFFIPAMGATMLNVVMIASVLWLAPRLGLNLPKDERLPSQIFALAYGVLAAGVAQAAFQVPTLWRDGFRYRWVMPWRDETVRRVIVKMVPGAIGLAAFQINVTLVQAIAFYVNPSINASFSYAVRLMELPQGMFGISLATYLLTALSTLAVEKNYNEFRTTLRNGLGTMFFANLIASVLLLVLAAPIVRLLFQRGEFDAQATMDTSFALACLAPGLAAFSSVNILARAFYALGDTKTPMKVSIVCLVLNLILSVALVGPWKQGGLGIANTVTSICNVSLLLFGLHKKLGKLEMAGLLKDFLWLLSIAVLSGVIAWFGWQYWENSVGHATLALRIGAVFGPAIVAGVIYWGLALAVKVHSAKEMLEFMMAKLKRQ